MIYMVALLPCQRFLWKQGGFETKRERKYGIQAVSGGSELMRGAQGRFH